MTATVQEIQRSARRRPPAVDEERARVETMLLRQVLGPDLVTAATVAHEALLSGRADLALEVLEGALEQARELLGRFEAALHALAPGKSTAARQVRDAQDGR